MTKQDLLQIQEVVQEVVPNIVKKEITNVQQEILDKVGLAIIRLDEKIDSNHQEVIKFIQEQTDKILNSLEAQLKK
jgi:hypothetical protein